MVLESLMILIQFVLDVKRKIAKIAMVMKPMVSAMFVSQVIEESLLAIALQIQIFHTIANLVIVIV